MKIRVLVTGTAIALFLASCAGPVASNIAKQGAGVTGRGVVTAGTSFTAGDNPFIYNSSIYNSNPAVPRNSSDPAAVWAPTSQGNKLLMVTSSDLKMTVPVNVGGDTNNQNFYPMDTTYLYVLDPQNTGNNTWRDIGAIAKESDIPWTDHVTPQNHMWAPDIDYMGNTYFTFVPARVSGTQNQRIAVLTRSTDPYGKFTYSDYVHIAATDGSGEQYAYDPGVFHLNSATSAGDYYIAYCDQQYPAGRIEIARFTNNGLTQTTNLGKVKISGLPANSAGSTDYYMEGPDLVQINGIQDQQWPMVYLQFAAKVESDQQEYIGYAYQTVASFVADPANGWRFGGWIQKQIDPSPGNNPSPETAEWTNHATIVPIQPPTGPTKYYYMYQFSQGDNVATDGQMRQVSMREIRINPADLTIQGTFANVAGVPYSYLDHEPYPFDGVQYSGQSRSSSPQGAPAFLGVNFFINNPTETTANGWDFLYYIQTENGKSPIVDSPAPSGFTNRVRHFGLGNVWVVDFQTPSTLTARSNNVSRGQAPGNGVGYSMSIRYTDSSPFDTTNDFSAPLKQGFTDTDKLPVFGPGGKIAGKSPHINIRSASSSTTTTGKELTGSTELVGPDNMLAGMTDHSWDTQQWELEPVPGTDYVRIKNTKYGLYLNTTTTNEQEHVTLHALDSTWWAEQWLIGSDGTVQNRWSGRYLTLGDPAQSNNHDRADYVTVWSQALNASWDTQKWIFSYDTW